MYTRMDYYLLLREHLGFNVYFNRFECVHLYSHE